MTERNYARGSYGFHLYFRLTDKDSDEPKDLTPYDRVIFRMWSIGESSLKIFRDCVIRDADHGECSVLVQMGDFDEIGEYYGQIEMRSGSSLDFSEKFDINIYYIPVGACEDLYELRYEGEIPMYISSEGIINLSHSFSGNISFEVTTNYS